MRNHQTSIVGRDAYQAVCTCGARSPLFEHRWGAEDWNRTHLDLVFRARAHLGKTPSLKNQRDYYQSMADATEVSHPDHALWCILAEGLNHRLGTGTHDEPLW